MDKIELQKAFEELQERHKFLVEKCDDMYSILKAQQEEIENLRQTCQSMMEGIVVSQPRIVRCKDCKHRDPEDHKCDCGHDIQWQLPRPDDWFCADGKRKESR